MSTRPDSRQILNRAALSNIGAAANTTQDSLNSKLNVEVDSPLRLAATFPIADAKLNFSNSLVSTADGASKAMPPIAGLVFESLSGAFINFQTQAVSNAPDFTITFPASTVGRFRRAGFTLNSLGKIEVIFSPEALTEGALANPGTVFATGTPLGYVNLVCTNASGLFKTAGSATDIIENVKIFRFGAGGGSGSSLVVQDEGVTIDSSVSQINFTGSGVVATQTAPGIVEVSISGGGSGAGTDLISTLAQEEANTLPAVDPYLILDDFNEVRGTLVNTERSGSKLQLQAGQISGTYVRQREVTSVVTKVSGISRVSPTACAPSNVAVFSDTFTFLGDVTNLFPTTKAVLIVKQTVTDGIDAYIALTGLDGKVARLNVLSCTYDGGSNTTEVELDNPDALDLDLDVAPSNYSTDLRVMPMDVQFEASGSSSPSYESMDIDDLSMWSPKVLANPAESTAAFEVVSWGGPIIRMSGDMSDNGTYGVIAALVNTAASTNVWKFAYTKNGGASWTLAAYTEALVVGAAYSSQEAIIQGYMNSWTQVANNGKAFCSFQNADGTLSYHVKGVYTDLSIGSPVFNQTAATGVDAENSVGTSGYLFANTTANRTTSGLAVDRADLSFIAIAGNRQNDTVYVRWFTAGGATYMGADLSGYTHLYGRRSTMIVTGTSGSHRTFLFNSATSSNMSYKYWDEPSTTAVTNVLVLAADVFQHDCRFSGTKAYLLYRDNADDAPKYISFNTNGTPTFSAVRSIVPQLDVDEYFGLSLIENLVSQPYNSIKYQGPQIAINPSDTDQVFFGLDLVHPDGLTRATVVEVRDDSTFAGAVINNVAAPSGDYGIRNDAGTHVQLAQTVTLAGEKVRTFSVRGYIGGAGSVIIPTGHDVTCELQATTAGLPNGTVVATALNTYAASDVTTNTAQQMMHFRFDTQTLTGVYAFVFKSTYPITGTNKYVLLKSTGTTYAGGAGYRFDGSTWLALSDDFYFELNSEWIYDIDSLRAKKQRDTGILLLDSTETSLVWSENVDSPVLLSRVSAQTYGLSRRPVTGWPFNTVFTQGAGSTASSFSTPRYLGYDNHDERLVFSTECGATSSARIDVDTSAVSTTEMAEDRSGLAQVINSYTSVTFGTQALFTSGKSAVFNTTSSKIIHDSGAGSFFDDALALLKNGSPFALEVEFSLTTLPSVKGASSIVVSKYFDGNADPGWFLLVNTSNRLVFGKAGGTLTNTEGSTVLTTGTRYLVKVTGDGTTVRMYIDGSEVSYISQNTTAYDVGTSTHRLCLGNVYNTSIYGLGGDIGYVKLSKGSSTFAGVGFANQAAITHLQNVTYGFIGQRHIGQISDDTADYDQGVYNSFSGGAAVVDSYDMLLKHNHSITSTGRFLDARISMARASDRNKIAIPGFNWQYNK